MVHLSVAVGEFFRILLTTMFGTALRLIAMAALASAAVAVLVLIARALVRQWRRR